MNMAWAEMYLLLSTLFRRFEMELWGTDKGGLWRWEADFFLLKMKGGRGEGVDEEEREVESCD